jgi:glycine/serine hydroxymethyltransferase
MHKVADWIDRVCRNISRIDEEAPVIRKEIAEFCSQFTVPGTPNR